jgi:hypothetical protein
VVDLVGPKTEAPHPAAARALFTSGCKPSDDLAAALADFGLEPGELAPLPAI